MAINFEYIDQVFDNNYWKVFYYDGSTYTQITDSSTMDYFSDSAVAGHALIFSFSTASRKAPGKIEFNVGTALSGTDVVLKWYRSTHNSVITTNTSVDLGWEEITVTDNTNGFTTTGQNDVIIPSAEGWANDKYTPITTSLNNLYLKVEIDSLTSISEGGAQTTDDLNFPFRQCTITTGYMQGTITTDQTTTTNSYMWDSAASFTYDNTSGRAVWFPGNDYGNRHFPIRTNSGTTNRLYFGSPYPMAPRYFNSYVPEDHLVVTGDTYAVSYKMEDLYQACLTAGLDWITASFWMPRRQEHLNYIFDCSIKMDCATSSDLIFISGFEQTYYFTQMHTIAYDFSYRQNCSLMFGIRAQGYNEDGTHYTSEDVVGWGCQIHFQNDYCNNADYLTGEFNGCNINSGLKYNYLTTLRFNEASIYDCRFGSCQMSDFYEVNGNEMTHCPVAEPLRNPSDTMDVKSIRSESGIVYITGNYSRTIEGGSSPYHTPWSSYGGNFTEANGTTETILNKTATTRTQATYGLVTDPSGHWNFTYSLEFKISDADNNPISGASIIVTNKDGTEVINDTTDSNGLLEGNTVLQLDQYHDATGGSSDSIETDYNPFEIIVTKNGYETYHNKLNVLKARYLDIELKKAIDVMPVIGGKGVAVKVNKENYGNDRDLIILP